MATFPLPIIRPEEYQSFRDAVGPDLADTYDEWLKLHGEHANELSRRGETIIPVEVDFDQFIAFCRAAGAAPDLKRLLDFTITKAGEH